jgi:hypothetical protein
MFKTITSLLTKRRTLHAELEIDHIELSEEHLILGLRLTWHNETLEPIEIREVMVNLFHEGKKKNPVSLIYNGRFVRIPYQKAITQIAGANSFHIEAGCTQVESLRFLTRDLLDIKDGSHPAELHTTVRDGTYLHNFDLKIVPELKHRIASPDAETGPQKTATSSVFTRALRLGLTHDESK